MLRYLRALFYTLRPKHKKLREMYYDDLTYTITYLQQVTAGEVINYGNIFKTVCNITTVVRLKDLTIFKLSIYKHWDFQKEFLPTDIAWMAVDGNHHLRLLSFDKDLFYHMIINEMNTHAFIEKYYTTNPELHNATKENQQELFSSNI